MTRTLPTALFVLLTFAGCDKSMNQTDEVGASSLLDDLLRQRRTRTTGVYTASDDIPIG